MEAAGRQDFAFGDNSAAFASDEAPVVPHLASVNLV